MHVNNVSINSQNFMARIKMNKPKLEVLAQTALGTSAVAAGAAAVADGAFSANLMPDAVYKSTPEKILESHGSILTEDNDGQGIPVQSTILPTVMSGAGGYVSNLGSNAFKNAIGKDNLKAITAIPADSAKAVTANKYAEPSAVGSGYLSVAGASLYSGYYGDEVNQMLPHSIQLEPGFYEDHVAYEYGVNEAPNLCYVEDCASSSAISGAGSLGLPVTAGSLGLLSKASDMKSSHFIKDTFSQNNKDKKLPS